MISELVNLLSDAGLDLTYDQILDAVWLAGHLPKPEPAEPPKTNPASATGARKPEGRAGSTTPPRTSSSRGARRETGSAPAGQAPGELFVPKPGISQAGTMRATPVRVPAADALPNKSGVNAALRPLKRRYPSRRERVLDVTATVEQIANGGPAVPILRAAPERWLEVSLIVDESASMRVWRETIEEFETLLERHGSFRDVRSWYVNLDDETVKLYSEPGLGNAPRRLRHLMELIDPEARRLILVVSDCVSKGWRNRAMFRAMLEWGSRGPVALVQVLPERLWRATALGEATVLYRAYSAGVPNARLHPQKSMFDLLRDLDRIAEAEAQKDRTFPDLPQKPREAPADFEIAMPVINLEGWSVAPWARLVANIGEAMAEGVTIRVPKQAPPSAERKISEERRVELTAEDRVRRFRSAASPGARLLAGCLAAAPLCLPVMRLVQKAMMPTVRQVDLAEVFLGGLFHQATPPDKVGRSEDVFYDFHPGVRELLLDAVREADQKHVLREVSRLIESQTGSTVDFQALLTGDTSSLAAQSVYPIGEKFADIAAKIAQRWWGGQEAPARPPEKREARAEERTQSPFAPATPFFETPAEDTPIKVYISFASEDFGLANEAIGLIKALDWEGLVHIWSAIDLRPGEMTEEAFRKQLEGSNVFVPLLSPRYVESKWAVRESETATRKGMLIVPLPLEPVDVGNHPVAQYVLDPPLQPLTSADDKGLAIALFADQLWVVLRGRVFQKALEAVVTVEAAGITSSGFCVTPWGHIAMLQQLAPAGSVIETTARGISSPATVVAGDPQSEFVLLATAPSSNLPEPLFFAHSRDIGQMVMGVSPDGNWMGAIVGRDDQHIQLLTDSPLRPGIGGAPVLDKAGRVVAVIQSLDTRSNEYLCIPSERVQQFVNDALDRVMAPEFNVSAIGVRVGISGGRLDEYGVSKLLSGSRGGTFPAYHDGSVSVDVVQSEVARSLTGTGFRIDASLHLAEITVGGRLKIDRLTIAAYMGDAGDGRHEQDLHFTTLAIEGMAIDGYPIHVELLPEADQDASLVQSISTSHPAATVIGSTLIVSDFGQIEILPRTNSPADVTLYALRITRLNDKPSSMVWLGILEVGTPVDASRPQSKPLSALVVGSATLNLPMRTSRAAQVVGGAIARAGARLVTRGWPGVDHFVATAFSEQGGLGTADDLTQVVEKPEKAHFAGGRVMNVARGSETKEAIALADVLIMVGGTGGTWQAFLQALSHGKPVIPFLFDRLSEAYHAAVLLEIFGENVPSELLRADFLDENQAQIAAESLHGALLQLGKIEPDQELDNRDLLWVAQNILELAKKYLKEGDGAEEIAQNIVVQFKSHPLPEDRYGRLVSTLLEDDYPAWRCAGYMAMEANADSAFVELLLPGLARELREALDRKGNRPLMRWLAAISGLARATPDSFPDEASESLQNAASAIRARPDVDPEQECEAAIEAVLEKLRGIPRAEAFTLSGFIKRPFEQIIHQQGYLRLPWGGGQFNQRGEWYRLEGILSIGDFGSHVSGSGADPNKPRVTMVRARIEKLNIADVVTADALVVQISVQHREGELTPDITFLGTQFRDLRIAGSTCEVTLDLDFARQKVVDLETDPPPISLVKKISGEMPARITGNVIHIPQFGTLSLGELVIRPDLVQLTMIRCQLDGLALGSLEICRASVAKGFGPRGAGIPLVPPQDEEFYES